MKKLSHILIAVILLSACGTKNKDAAEREGNRFFNTIKAKEFTRALNFYGEKFYDHVDRDDWRGSLVSLNEKLGDLKSYKLERWKIDTKSGIAGTYYSLEYRVAYSNKIAKETLTLLEKENSEEIKIIRHEIRFLEK